MVPLLVLGHHQKREEPGDKAVAGLLSPPHSGGGRSVTGREPCLAPGLEPRVVGMPLGPGCSRLT